MSNLALVSPEIIIIAVAFIVLTLEIAWKGDWRSATILPWVAFGGAIVALLAIMAIWPATGPTTVIATDGMGLVPMMAADRLAMFFKIIAVLTVALVGLSAVDYLNKRTPFRGEFYVLMLLSGSSLMFLSAATNLILIYLSLEFLSVTSYILTAYFRQDIRSIEAGIKYLLYGAVASGVMLYGFSLLYGATGSVDLVEIAQRLPETDLGYPFIIITTFTILAGFGFKIALVPFHQWSPDAYQGAPTPVTAFLSVGPKAAGLAVLMRVFVVALPEYAINWTVIMSLIAILSMTLGNLVALWQTNVKRMLAYSSIAQAGYMIIGMAAWSASPDGWTNGVQAIMIYSLAYAFTNIGIFAIVIALENKLGTAEIADYAGLLRRSPFFSIALLVFLLSLIGIPPTGGFMGKLFVFGAALDQGLYILATVGIVNSVISVYYYFNLARLAFFEQGLDDSPLQPGFAMNSVVGLTMALTILMAVYVQPFINLTQDPAQQLIAWIF